MSGIIQYFSFSLIMFYDFSKILSIFNIVYVKQNSITITHSNKISVIFQFPLKYLKFLSILNIYLPLTQFGLRPLMELYYLGRCPLFNSLKRCRLLFLQLFR